MFTVAQYKENHIILLLKIAFQKQVGNKWLFTLHLDYFILSPSIFYRYFFKLEDMVINYNNPIITVDTPDDGMEKETIFYGKRQIQE